LGVEDGAMKWTMLDATYATKWCMKKHKNNHKLKLHWIRTFFIRAFGWL
jgi:hypothetical protein